MDGYKLKECRVNPIGELNTHSDNLDTIVHSECDIIITNTWC